MDIRTILKNDLRMSMYMVAVEKSAGNQYLILPLVVLTDEQKNSYLALGATHVLYNEFFNSLCPVKGLKPLSLYVMPDNKFTYELWRLKESRIALRYPDGWAAVPITRKHKKFLKGESCK